MTVASSEALQFSQDQYGKIKKGWLPSLHSLESNCVYRRPWRVWYLQRLIPGTGHQMSSTTFVHA